MTTGRDSMIPARHGGADYMNFMPWLAAAQDVTHYLEIGVNMGHLLQRMHVDHAIGVDPAFVLNVNVAQGKKDLRLVQKTSDRYFAEDRESVKLFKPQLAFLDGMHLFEYLLRDFINTEAICSSRSLIVMHDCLPLTPEMCHRSQDVSRTLTEGTPYYGWWTGDVWKIVPILRRYRPDLKVVCVDAAPTGLVCISNLDSSSSVLSDSYLDIVDAFSKVPNSTEHLQQLYSDNQIVSTSTIMDGNAHGIYFRN